MEVRWSTVSVEQGHAIAALIHRHHRYAGRESISMRSHLHQIRPLLHSEQQRRLRVQAESRIQRLRAKIPRRRSARQQFVAEMFLEATSKMPPGATLAQSTKVHLLSNHAKIFTDLSEEQKQALQDRADCESRKAMASIADELQGLEVKQGATSCHIFHTRIVFETNDWQEEEYGFRTHCWLANSSEGWFEILSVDVVRLPCVRCLAMLPISGAEHRAKPIRDLKFHTPPLSYRNQ